MQQHLIIKHMNISLMKCMNIHTKQDKYETINRLMSVQAQFCHPGSCYKLQKTLGLSDFQSFRNRDLGLWIFCHHSHHHLAFDIIAALVLVTSASLLLPMSHP